ncbi:hypothetical protein C8J55DRAFT_555273 [Lentinula edodes]|uniref:Uncharacterized protein n=1 Tax=Lentinula lateritia TaxID=40482 RepID=A0A9W9B0Y3_9AGAR|nr:hypothetical protein C8J55DRAFT_555273 [Lentinula edodes]
MASDCNKVTTDKFHVENLYPYLCRDFDTLQAARKADRRSEVELWQPFDDFLRMVFRRMEVQHDMTNIGKSIYLILDTPSDTLCTRMGGQVDLASFYPTDLDAFPNSPAKIDGAAFVALEQRIPSSPIPQYLRRSYLTSPVKYKQEENGKIPVGHLQTVNRSEEMINVSVSIHCESGKVDLVLSTYI